MLNRMDKVLLAVALIALTTRTVAAIDCYQCVGTDPVNPFLCNEFLEDDQDLSPRGCGDVYGASYCVKHIGRFEGGIGTKRYCSALDLGNYCNYVQHLGDQLEYRSCVYTCSTDGCNGSSALAHSFWLLCFPAMLLAARAR